MKAKFREALEKKKAARHDPHGEGTSAKGVGPASNDKRKREFRRKSGNINELVLVEGATDSAGSDAR